ncbi:MAG: TetR/AcrR family transcriptional regulator [Solirubrobacterales bacterium]|nr:TetR/AcrR family transcriptional regulator [Solirubrobacterales bacterium]
MWPRADVKLIAGPHDMPPAEVLEVQRQRLLRALTRMVTRKGYAATTVRDLLGESGLSRRTYYDLYVDKEACYLDAFALIAAEIEGRATAALEEGEDPEERIRSALRAVATFCVQEPDAACACLVESLAAGQPGRDARSDLIGRLADAFAPDIEALGASGPSTAILARATIGGVFELLYGPLARRDVERLADLRDEIGDLPLVPLAAR